MFTDLKRHDFASEPFLTIVTVLYSVSLTVSNSFQNTLIWTTSCEPVVPFGECIDGEYDHQLEVDRSGSMMTMVKLMISFVVAMLAGT